MVSESGSTARDKAWDILSRDALIDVSIKCKCNPGEFCYKSCKMSQDRPIYGKTRRREQKTVSTAILFPEPQNSRIFP